MPQSKTARADWVQWTPRALPSVVVLTTTPLHLAEPRFRTALAPLNKVLAAGDDSQLLRLGGSTHRLEIDGADVARPALLLPFDRLFDVRLAAARRLWLALNRRKVPPDPARLTKRQRNRYVLALRALDGRLANASYREIATALFGVKRIPDRGWKTHDLRDRTIGLWELGRDMMQGGYRQLLAYPYRKRL